MFSKLLEIPKLHRREADKRLHVSLRLRMADSGTGRECNQVHLVWWTSMHSTPPEPLPHTPGSSPPGHQGLLHLKEGGIVLLGKLPAAAARRRQVGDVTMSQLKDGRQSEPRVDVAEADSQGHAYDGLQGSIEGRKWIEICGERHSSGNSGSAQAALPHRTGSPLERTL